MGVNITKVTEVKAVNQGLGRNDKFPIHKVELDSGREYLFKHGEFTAGGIVDTFIPIEWVSKNSDDIYDMSSQLKNQEQSNVRGILKLKPRHYKKYIKP